MSLASIEQVTPLDGRVARHARVLTRLGQVIAAEPARRDLLRIATRVVVDELAAGHCSIGSFDGAVLRPAAFASSADDGLDRRYMTAAPMAVTASVRALLMDGRAHLIRQPKISRFVPPQWTNTFTVQALALVPVVTDAGPVGLLAVDWPEAVISEDDDLTTLEALAAFVAGDLEQWASGVSVEDERAAALVAVGHVRAVARTVHSPEELRTTVNDIVAPFGIEVASIRFASGEVARRVGDGKATTGESRAWAAGDGWCFLSDGTVAVTVDHRERPLGTLRLRAAEFGSLQRALALAVAHEIGEAVGDRLADETARSRDEERNAAVERDHMRAQVARNSAQLFGAMTSLALHHGDRLAPQSAARLVTAFGQLGDAGKTELEWTELAIEHLPEKRRPLPSALRGFVRAVHQKEGVEAAAEVRGRARSLASSTERALFRVATGAVGITYGAQCGGHPLCAGVRVELAYTDDAVSVTVKDDGVSVDRRPRGSVRYAQLRQLIERVGGTLDLREEETHGVTVVATVVTHRPPKRRGRPRTTPEDKRPT